MLPLRTRALMAAFLLLACRPFPASTMPAADGEGPASVETTLHAATAFDTRPAGEPIRGDHETTLDLKRLAGAIKDARSPALGGDGRLAEVALVIARRHDPRSRELDLAALAPLMRERGLVNPLPQVLFASAPTLADARARVVEGAGSVAQQYQSTHFGVAARKRGTLWLVVAVFDRRPIELDPVPLELPVPQAVRVHARLLEGLTDIALVVTRPDGSVETAAKHPGGAELDHTLTLADGAWGIEIMGSGEHGPSVVANMVVHVGAPAPSAESARPEVGPATTAGFVTELERLLREERARYQLPALTRQAALDAVALAHSTDMRDNHFFGHVSPTTGSPADRVMRAAVPLWSVHENVARGYTPREVHASLMGSPAHRAGVLGKHSDRLGLGVVAQDDGGRLAFYVTELFASEPFAVDADQALNAAAAHVSAARTERGLTPLIPDMRLSEAAAVGAARFFTEPQLAQETLLRDAMKKARLPRGASAVTARLFLGMLPSALELTSELLDPDARFIGVGMATGGHPQLGPAGLAVVAIVAK
jgi:uncharacterized protein YkwD